MGDRAWRTLALAIVGLAVLLANYDPVIKQLPDLPGGGGLVVTETDKQAFALAAILSILTALTAIWLIVRQDQTAPGAALRVLAPTTIVAVAVFVGLYAAQSDDRMWFGVGTIVALAVAGVATLDAQPTFPTLSFSRLPLVTTVAAVVLIIGYAWILEFMLSKAGTDDSTEWERLVALFAGVESIGFAAVGALLGQQVQKSQTNAEAARADENKDIAATAKALGTQLNEALGAAEQESDPTARAGHTATTRVLAAQIANLRDPR